MGNWKITIEGVGPNRNADNDADADKGAEAMVAGFRANGHTVTRCEFVAGGKPPEDILIRKSILVEAKPERAPVVHGSMTVPSRRGGGRDSLGNDTAPALV